MGNFYTNITLKGPPQPDVVAHLNALGRTAYVSQSEGDCTVVFDALSDEQDIEVMSGFAAELSERLGCAALAVLNHDDDVFWYQLYSVGLLQDTYNSTPDYFDVSGESEPVGGDAEALCEAFEVDDSDEVEAILRDREEYLFALDRHEELLYALGLPACALAFGYNYIEAGDEPPGCELVKTG